MFSLVQLTLAVTLAIAVGMAGLFAALQDSTSQADTQVRVRSELGRVLTQVNQAHPDRPSMPLTALEVGTLPFGVVYCPASVVEEQGIAYVLVHPGANRRIDTTCPQALGGARIADDAVLAGRLKDVGTIQRAAGNTDWLPENVTPYKAGQVYIASNETLTYLDDTGSTGVFIGQGAAQTRFSVKCPADTRLILGSTMAGRYQASFCIDTVRTDANLTQTEAENACVARGRKLISDEQFSRTVEYMNYLGGSNPNSISYPGSSIGVPDTVWPSTTNYRGLPRGSNIPAYGPTGNDPTASANPASRRWWQAYSSPGNPGYGSFGNRIWDLAGAPQWTSTRVAHEDIGKPLSSGPITGWVGYPDTTQLDKWSTSYALSGQGTSWPNGVRNIAFLLTPEMCNETLPISLRWLAKQRCGVSSPPPEQAPAVFTHESLDAGVGGYYAEPATGVSLGIARGGAWPGTRMSSGVFALAIVPSSHRAAHRCVVAPKETAAR